MTVSLKHNFTSPVTDNNESDEVGPDEWNAEHTLTLDSDRLLGRDSTGSGAVEEISVVAPVAFNGSGGLRLTGTLAQFNSSLSDDDFVSLTGSETLANKTLTSPVISSPALSADSVDAITEIASALKSGADGTLVTGTAGTNGLAQWNVDGDLIDGPTPPSGTIVGTTDSQTLTNKTIDFTDNTVTMTKAELDTAVSDDNVAYLGTAQTFTANQTVDGSQLALTPSSGGGTIKVNPEDGFAQTSVERFTANTLGPLHVGIKGRGTVSSKAAANANDQALRFVARSYNGTQNEDAAEFNAILGDTNVTGSGNHPSGQWDFYSRSSAYTSQLNVDQLNLRIAHDGEVYFPEISTTASAANAFLDNGSSPAEQLLRSTSSLRFKTDIEPIEEARASAFLAQARPIWYRSLAKFDKLADGAQKTFYSFGAEDLAEIDPRYATWGYHAEDWERVEVEEERDVEVGEDEDGNPVIETRLVPVRRKKLKEGATRKPDGINMNAVVAMLTSALQKEREERKKLEARVAALER